MKSGIPYEFRTTALKKLLEENDILDIASLIKNARLYVLQQFIPSKVLDRGFIKYESYSRDELESLSKKIAQRIANILIR
jgi:pyruvate formate lyase activating enzyme